MMKKVQKQVYGDRHDLIDDFSLLVENCHEYNGPKSGEICRHRIYQSQYMQYIIYKKTLLDMQVIWKVAMHLYIYLKTCFNILVHSDFPNTLYNSIPTMF